MVKYRMHTNPVIIGLNIHEHRLPYLPHRMFAVQGFQFPLQGLEKRFGTGVVPAVPLLISCSVEPRDKAPPATHESFSHNTVPLVGMKYQPLLGLPGGKGHLQGGNGRMNAFHIGAEGPANGC
jgi:hypothetical protein